jgi:hypothetical protein
VAKTLLNAVNELLKRVNVIAGDAAALTTLTDSARQHPIDIAVQVINEGVDEIYSISRLPKPNSQAESTITLATGTRAYALAADLVTPLFPLRDKTNTQFIWEFPGGYNGLLDLDPEQDDTGLPIWGAISPVNGYLHLNCAPTSADNGKVYTYQYQKDLVMSATADTVPFSNACFRAMVPVWAQLYKREMKNEFDQPLYQMAIGRAARFLADAEPRSSYSPRGG